MDNFITTRVQQQRERVENPTPLKYYEVQENENGERKFVPADIVKPSMASDFSVQNNAIYNRIAHGISARISCDLVDFDNKVNELYNE